MTSTSITSEDLLTPSAYEKVRGERVAAVIKLKNVRRVDIGPWISCAFENRETVLHQIQEMIRIERLTEPAAVAQEIEAYADLLPKEHELSLTLFIEIPNDEQRKKALAMLGGIEKTLTLTIGKEQITAFDKRPIDPRWERPGMATAVYYLGFIISPPSRALLAGSGGEAVLKFSHPNYKHAAVLSDALRRTIC